MSASNWQDKTVAVAQESSEPAKERQAGAVTPVRPAAIRAWYAAIFVLLAVGAAVPFFTDSLTFWFYLFQWVALATGINLMAGFTGYLPFGYVAFFGVGAYVTAVVVQFHGGSMALGILSAAAAGAVVACAFAPTMRLTGIFFSIVSFSLAVVLQHLISNLPNDVAGGSSGIIYSVAADPKVYFYVMVAIAGAAVLLVTFIATSRVGMMLKAMRDDSEAASVIGINVARLRLGAWILSCVIASVTGAVEGLYTAIIDPVTSFNVLITAKAIIFASVGGMGTVIGPVFGAVSMSILDEMIWARFPAMNLFILGAVIVAIVLYLPKGVVGTLLHRRPRLRKWLF